MIYCGVHYTLITYYLHTLDRRNRLIACIFMDISSVKSKPFGPANCANETLQYAARFW